MTADASLLIRRASIKAGIVDVRVRKGVVAEVGDRLDIAGERLLDASCGALLPGLHDHHLHLHALAAWLESVRCGPPVVRDHGQLVAALRRASGLLPPDRWLRGVGYHESVDGPLDRDVLDAIVSTRPVRVQHRSGAMWFLNSAAISVLDLDSSPPPGTERDVAGRPTGRLRRADAWLRSRLPTLIPSLATVGDLLSAAGVTAVTDATPDLAPAAIEALESAVAGGDVSQRVTVMGAASSPRRGLRIGPRKIVLDEFEGVDLARIEGEIRSAHEMDRPVAIHCVTRAEVVLAVAALEAAGPLPGDRLEHASICPRGLDSRLRQLGVTIVTQPGFVTERGAEYFETVEADDLASLYRLGSFVAAGIPLAAGTDAPFGSPDPWTGVAAAVNRAVGDGRRLGEGEQLTPERALALFLGPSVRPAAPPPEIRPGMEADLCILDRPLERALESPRRSHILATIIGGRVQFEA